MRRFDLSKQCVSFLSCNRHIGTTPVFMSSKPTSSDPLDELFSELQEVETSSGLGKKAASGVSRSPRSGKASVTFDSGSSKEKGKIRTPAMHSAKATKAALQRALDEAKAEELELMKEHTREERSKRMDSFRPSAPARTFLSTGEMIADKAPQHFVAAVEEPKEVPELMSHGSAAVVSLVGKVVRRGGRLDEHEGVCRDIEEPTFDLGVEYTVPFLTRKSSEVLVRCVGVTLATFAKEHVQVGDIVHVLGHLVPVTEDGNPCSQVYALPLGGNVSVVIRLPPA